VCKEAKIDPSLWQREVGRDFQSGRVLRKETPSLYEPKEKKVNFSKSQRLSGKQNQRKDR
jgi:hypothetical protein